MNSALLGVRTLSHCSYGTRTHGWRALEFQPCLFLFLWLSVFIASGQIDYSGEWTSFSAKEAAQGRRVVLKGTVLCYDQSWGQLYLHDGKETSYLNPLWFTNQFEIGQKVEIRATTFWDGTSPALTNTLVQVQGQTPLPQPIRIKMSDLAKHYGQWVELSAWVRLAEGSQGRVTLLLRDGTYTSTVYVMQTTERSPFRYLQDAWVSVRGINASRMENGKFVSAPLFVPRLDMVKLLKPGTRDRWSLPITAIDSLLTKPLGDWTNHPVHLSGLIDSYEPGSRLTFHDPTGALEAEVIQSTPASKGQRVEVWGFLTTRSNRTVLADAYFELSGGSSGTEPPAIVSKPPPIGPPITNAREIRRMTRAQANEGRIARLQGVLTYADPAWRVVFLQTTNDGIFLDTDQPDLRAGQYVEVTGQTQEGGFAPQLVHCTTEILGTTNFPTPARVTVKDTADGSFDSHWIEIEGSVRRVSKESDHISMTLTSPDGRFSAVVFDPGPAPAPTELVDAVVTLRGACGSQVNSRGQLNGITVEVPNRDQIRIVDASPADPFTVAPTPISKVATFNAEARSRRRVKVSGVVTLVSPDRTFYLQDESAGIRVQTTAVGQVHIGQPLEAVGFPALLGFSPHLEEAIIRPAGLGRAPAAVRTEAEKILKTGKTDGVLVELEAELLQSATKAAQARFLLQDGAAIFTAQMALPTLRHSFPEMTPGSLVRVRGICVIQGTENREPASFHLLLPDVNGIRVIQTAPWWTLRHTLLLAGGIALGGLIAAMWVISLRRQVRAQTDVIQRNQRELMEASRQAGMAEIATSVLHNVGNVLNSVNVSATLATDRLKNSSIPMLSRTVDLMEQHRENLGEFITNNARGKNLPPFLKSLAARLQEEKAVLLKEMEDLRHNIEHIKQIVAMQQGFARASTMVDAIEPTEIIEDALRINASGLTRAGINVKRQFDPLLGNVRADKHKLLQILINLIGNAKNACAESRADSKEIVLSATRSKGVVEISVQDNGVGIPPENLTRIFNFGFTTRENGHGFGLHSSALAAKEMGARLTAHSDGPGHGARFTLEMSVPETSTSKPNGAGEPVGL